MMNKRKIVLINQKLQLSILMWVTIFTIMLIGVFYATIWYFFYGLKQEAIATGLPQGHVYFNFLTEQKLGMDHIFLAVSGGSFLLIFFGGLFLSHKIAGPIHQLVVHMQEHSKSNITPLSFRKGDYFSEVEIAFNEFIKKK